MRIEIILSYSHGSASSLCSAADKKEKRTSISGNANGFYSRSCEMEEDNDIYKLIDAQLATSAGASRSYPIELEVHGMTAPETLEDVRSMMTNIGNDVRAGRLCHS